MANNASARKRIRQIEVRTRRNRVIKNRLKASRKAVLASIESGDAGKAKEDYDKLASAADIAAKKNVIHKNAASRIKSRVAQKINALSA